MNKVRRDGSVAVLVSPGFGAGWYSWNNDHPGLLFDPDIIAAVLANDRELAEQIAERKYKDSYAGGADTLMVCWVPNGERFRIEEFDGNEELILESQQKWIVA